MRKLKKIDVGFISLVDKGANRKRLIFKNRDCGALAIEKTIVIKKTDEEQRMVFCIVYSPDEIDTQGDFAPASVIKEAAYNFMRCARTNNVDKQHDFIPDEGFVAESWLVKENDPVFPSETSGSWAVGIKVENDETWQLIKEGEITGLSLAGLAVTEDVDEHKSSCAEETDEPAGVCRRRTEKCEVVEKVIKERGEEVALLKERIELVEKQNTELNCRVAKIEKSVPVSRQIKREDETTEKKVKIWT